MESVDRDQCKDPNLCVNQSESKWKGAGYVIS